MNIRTLTWVLGASLALATPALAAAVPDAPAAAPSGALRPVGVITATAQTLWYDSGAGQYVFRKLGETANGAQLVAFDAGHVVLEADGARQVWTLSVAPTPLPPGLADATATAAAAAPAAITAAAPAPPVAGVIAAAPTPPAPTAATAPISAPVPVTVVAPPPVVVATPPVAAATPPAPSATVEPAAIPPKPVELPPSAEGAATVMARVIPRADLDRELGDFAALGRQVSITARAEGGYQLAHVVGFASRVGLRDGDVVLRVDGRNLATLQDAAAAYAWLRIADHFTVDILRDGQPQRLHFVITPTAPAAQAKR